MGGSHLSITALPAPHHLPHSAPGASPTAVWLRVSPFSATPLSPCQNSCCVLRESHAGGLVPSVDRVEMEEPLRGVAWCKAVVLGTLPLDGTNAVGREKWNRTELAVLERPHTQTSFFHCGQSEFLLFGHARMEPGIPIQDASII